MATVSIVEVILRAKDEASRVLEGVGKQVEANAAALKKVGAVAAGAGVAIGGALGAAVKAASDFESQMSGVKAVMSPAEVAEFGGALETLALRLGKDTAYSATAAAQGIEELVKAGVPAEAVLRGAGEAALSLAAAGGVSLPKAAEVASNALNAFKIPAEEMARAVNTFAGAANASASDISELQFGMQAVSAVAATVGLTLEDTVRTLALFSNSTLKGSDAGTSLKTMLMNLQPSTKAQVAEFQRLGLVGINSAGAFTELSGKVAANAQASAAWEKQVKAGTGTLDNLYKIAGKFAIVDKDVDFNKWAFDAGYMGNQFFDAAGSAKSMSDIAGVLATSLEGMTQQQKLASLEIMFGSDAVRAAAILAREGATGFDAMTAAIEKVEAADVAKTRLDNLAGSTEQLKGSLETAAIEMGQRLLPTMRALVDTGTGLLNTFLELPGPIKDAIVVAAVIAAGLLTLGGTMVLLTPAVLSLGGAFAAVAALTTTTLVPALAALWTALLGPLGLAIAAVVIAVGLLYLAWHSNFGGIQEIVATAWESIRGVFAAIGGALSQFGTTILPDLQRAWEAVTTRVSEVWTWLLGHVSISLWDFRGTWETAWGAIALVVRAVWDTIAAVVGAWWELVQGIIIAGLKVLQGDWRGAWQALVDHLGAAANIMAGRVNELIGGLKDAFAAAGPALLRLLIDGINRLAGELLATVRRLVGDVAALLPHSLAEEGPLSRPTDWRDALMGNLDAASENLVDTVQKTAGDIDQEWDSLLSIVRARRASMGSELDTLAADFQEQVPLITAAVTDIADEPDSLLARFRAARAGLNSELDTLVTDFADAVPSVVDAVAEMNEGADSLLARFRASREGVSAELATLATGFGQAVTDVVGGTATLSSAHAALLNQVQQTGSALTTLMAAEATYAAQLVAARREPYVPTGGGPVDPNKMLKSWMETRKGQRGEVQEYSWGQKWIPYFQQGGIVPGPINAPRLVMAHGGEQISSSNSRAAGGGVTVNYYQQAPVYGFNSFEDSVVAAVDTAKRRGRLD